MSKYLITIIFSAALFGCNSTTPAENRSQPNKTKMLTLELRAERGDEDAKYRLAILYAKNKSTLYQAMNLLRSLADNKHHEGTNKLVLYETLGYEGTFKDDALYKYFPENDGANKTLEEYYRKLDLLKKNYAKNTVFWDNWYKQAFSYCNNWDTNFSAPLPLELNAEYAHIVINNMESCLRRSTVQDIRAKWLLVSLAGQKQCDDVAFTKNDPRDRCRSEVSRWIGGVDRPNFDNPNWVRWIVIGLDELIDSNKIFLSRSDTKNLAPSSTIQYMLENAHRSYQSGRLYEATRVVENFLEKNKPESLSAYDLAFTYAYVGNIYVSLGLDTEEKEKEEIPLSISDMMNRAIEYKSMSVEKDILDPRVHHRELHQLASLYLLNDDYRAAFKTQLRFLKYSEATNKIYDPAILESHLKIVEKSLAENPTESAQ